MIKTNVERSVLIASVVGVVPQQCYINSAKAAIAFGLVYVEGWAIFKIDDMFIPIEHAWNLNEEGEIVDTTAVFLTGNCYHEYFPVSQWSHNQLEAGIYPLASYQSFAKVFIEKVEPYLNC